MISATESSVTALLVQTSFYGLYMATFGICLRWLLFADEGWKLRRPLDWPMLTVAVLVFTSFTMWLGANARITMEHIINPQIFLTPADLYYIYALGAVTIAGTAVIILATDAVMIYRCWKVYNKSWRITVLPGVFWLGCLISFIMAFYYNHQLIVLATNAKTISQLNAVNNVSFQSNHAHSALYPFNAATNIYTTTAIVYRIMHDASKSGHGLKRLQHLCRILAETGFLYTMTTIPPLVAFFLDPKKYLIVLQVAEAVNFSMAGIAFNIVLIRVGQSRANAGGSRLDSQATDHQKLILGHHHRYPSSSTQGDAEKGIISTTNALGESGWRGN